MPFRRRNYTCTSGVCHRVVKKVERMRFAVRERHLNVQTVPVAVGFSTEEERKYNANNYAVRVCHLGVGTVPAPVAFATE